MQKIDHIGLQVTNVKEAVAYYHDTYDCMILYCDDTWAFIQFDNIKLALVTNDQHPYHIAFETNDEITGDLHRDNSISYYTEDPSGNKIEIIKYEK